MVDSVGCIWYGVWNLETLRLSRFHCIELHRPPDPTTPPSSSRTGRPKRFPSLRVGSRGPGPISVPHREVEHGDSQFHRHKHHQILHFAKSHDVSKPHRLEHLCALVPHPTYSLLPSPRSYSVLLFICSFFSPKIPHSRHQEIRSLTGYLQFCQPAERQFSLTYLPPTPIPKINAAFRLHSFGCVSTDFLVCIYENMISRFLHFRELKTTPLLAGWLPISVLNAKFHDIQHCCIWSKEALAPQLEERGAGVSGQGGRPGDASSYRKSSHRLSYHFPVRESAKA